MSLKYRVLFGLVAFGCVVAIFSLAGATFLLCQHMTDMPVTICAALALSVGGISGTTITAFFERWIMPHV